VLNEILSRREDLSVPKSKRKGKEGVGPVGSHIQASPTEILSITLKKNYQTLLL